MPLVDSRRKQYPYASVDHDRVAVWVSCQEGYTFSHEAWNFFVGKFEELILLDQRYLKRSGGLYESNPPRLVIDSKKGYKISSYPGPYVHEFFVQFREGKTSWKTHVRTARGQGSEDKVSELRNLLQGVKEI